MKKESETTSMKYSKRNKKTWQSKALLLFFSSIILFIFYISIPSIPSFNLFDIQHKNYNDRIILTFDDGPGEDTEKIINILNEKNASGIFFITCDHINASEQDIVKQISDTGNIVGLHGHNHHIFQSYSNLNQCRELLQNITGKEIIYFRPPYGFKSPDIIFAAARMNMTIMTWSVFPKDYLAENPQEIIDAVQNNLKPNSIIAFHDGPANRMNTVEALPQILLIIDEKKYDVENFI